MATKAINNIVRNSSGAQFPLGQSAKNFLDATVSFNQGDLLYFDGTPNLIKALASDANGATFCGVAQATVVLGKLKSPYTGTAVDAAEALADAPAGVVAVECQLFLKVGDAFATGDLVYGTAVDAQTVSSAGTNSLGRYLGKNLTAASGDTGIIVLKSAI